MNLLFVHRSVALIATLVLIFTSLGMPGSASAVNVPEPDTCNEEYTYTFSSKDFGDYGDDSSKPANIDYINTGDAGEPDRVSVSADAGFSITKVELSVDDDGNPGFVTVATGPITNHNPAGTEINVAKITVKKECPDACSNIAGIQATVPAGYETVTPGICTVIPQCRDGVDNTDAEDTLADASDPGCWSDPNNPNTYNGNDTDETTPTDVCPLVVGIQTSIESCPAETKATVHTAKVICDSEADLPNYGNNGPNITASTAQDWVTQSDGACELASNWNFQWAPSTATNPGDNVTSAGNPWTTFTGLVELLNPAGGTFWLRESIPANQGWVPFSGDITLPYNEYSAEFYCDTDVLHYDNFDFIAGVTAGEDYYCVAWNAKAPQCSDGLDNDGDEAVDYPSDLGCTSAQDNDETDIPPPPPLPQCSDGIDNVDSEDTLADASDPGCLSGPDNSYNPSDNDETDIPPPPPLPQCSDGIDNDGDEAIDYVVEGGDPGCSSPEDNDESDEPDSCEAGFHEEVVQEEAQTPFAPTICGEGFTLSGTQCVASAAPVCEGGTYNTDTNVCDIPGFPEEEIPPSTEPAACLAEGAVLNPDSDQCEVVGAAPVCPEGIPNVDGMCVPEAPGAQTICVPNDICPNIDGDQAEVPAGLVQTADGMCQESSQGRSGGKSKKGRSGGSVLGATTCAPLLTQYLHVGWDNDESEVTKLQEFLNGNLALTLPVNGLFGAETLAAVKQFQVKYGSEVLSPWVGLPASGIDTSDDATGFVYQTTRWQINNLWCPGSEAFPATLI